MAGKSTISITFKLDGDNKGFKDLAKDAEGLRKVLDGTVQQTERLNSRSINFAALTTNLRNAGRSIAAFNAQLKGLTDLYAAQESAETKLTTVMRERMDATDAEVQSIMALASAQQELGVIGDEVQLAGAQQMATFLDEKSSLDVLLPAMNNLIAQQKGLNATQTDAVTIGNLIGKVMQGQTSALRRVGITFDEAQEEVLKFGTESEKAATLAEVITQNVGNMNAELAKTSSGKVTQLKNAIGDLGEQVGKIVMPYLPMAQMAASTMLTVVSISSLVTSVRGLLPPLSLMSARTAISRTALRLMGLEAQNGTIMLRGTQVQATRTAIAIRGLMVATGVGAAIALLTVGIGALTNSLGRSKTAADNAAEGLDAVGRANEAYSSTMQSTYANLMTQYNSLQAAWKGLTTTHQKTAWIRDNQQAFADLGLEIRNVADAEDLLVNNTANVTKAFETRAKAAALMAKASAEYSSKIESDERVSDLESQLSAARAKLRTMPKPREAMANELSTPGGAASYRAERTNYDLQTKLVSDLEKALREELANGASISARASKYTEEAAGLSSGQTTVRSTATPTTTTPTVTANKSNTAVWRDEANTIAQINDNLSILQTRLNNVTADEAAGVNQQIAVWQEKKKAIEDAGKTTEQYNEQAKTLGEVEANIRALQSQLEDATAEQATDINRNIALWQELADNIRSAGNAVASIPSIAPEPESYTFEQGSTTDKRRSYDNAQSQTRRIQTDYEIGIIGKEEAMTAIQEVNEALAQLGLNPITVDLDAHKVDDSKRKFKGATDAISQMGSALSGLGDAVEEPALNIAGTIAQAIATLALSYADATGKAGQQLGPWGWIAFAAAGLAQLTAIISTIKSTTKFADGGVISGPTLGLMGEYAGAANNPEVVAPLSKLRGMLAEQGGGGGNYTFRVSGRDLVSVLANETRTSGRATNIRL